VTFALTVLPALLALGLTSYSRLADLAVHDGALRLLHTSHPGVPHDHQPSAQQYWLVPAGTP
jgi:hypothetical protein